MMAFILALLALAGAAGALGLVIGLAHGIEVERNRVPRRRPPVLAEGESMPNEEEIAV